MGRRGVVFGGCTQKIDHAFNIRRHQFVLTFEKIDAVPLGFDHVRKVAYHGIHVGELGFKFGDAVFRIVVMHACIFWIWMPPYGRTVIEPGSEPMADSNIFRGYMTDLSVLVFVVIILALIAIYSVRLQSVPMPTLRSAADEIIAYIPADIRSVTDFGSGWGDLAIAIARARPDILVTGIELSPVPYAISRMRAVLAGKPNLGFIRGDFRKLDRDPGDVVVCFIDPRVMADVGDVCSQRLRDGAIVISRGFAIPGWQAFGEVPMKTSTDRLYLYRFGKHKPA